MKQACDEKGIDFKQVENDLQQAATSGAGVTPIMMNGISTFGRLYSEYPSQLCEKNMPEIRNYAAKVFRVHGANHPELGPIQELVEQVNEELMEHMKEEEGILFPG